ncbi:hypothetical protein HK405_009695, partial [Cladochytrium tenue]
FGSELGLFLRRFNIELRPRLHQDSTPYENPHAATAFNSRFIYSNDSNADDATSQIDSVYNALIDAENLNEMEPDPRITTPMYKHQKQALFFMTEKETDVDFRHYNPKQSIWKLEADGRFRNMITNELQDDQPRQVRGGILA